MRGQSRTLRVAEQIRVELSEIVQRRLKDPRKGFITITDVEVTPDLRSARVFVSALDDESLAAGIGLLEHARGFLRSELGKRIRLRFVPELDFREDRSAARGRRIEDLLRTLHAGDDAAGPDEGDDAGTGEEE